MSLSKNSEGGIGVLALRAAASFEAAKLKKRRDRAKEKIEHVYFSVNNSPLHMYMLSSAMHVFYCEMERHH